MLNMNRAGLIIIFTFFIASLNLKAQNEALETRVSIHSENITVRELLDTITAQTGLYFSYSNAILNDTVPISISADSSQLHEILHMLVPQENTKFLLKNQHIIIKNRPKSKFRHIYGKITDRRNPLEAATVYLKNSLRGVITNTDGEFIIKVPPEHLSDTLIISHIGYLKKQILLSKAKNDTLHIKLEKHSILLEEIIVSGINPKTIVEKMVKNLPNHHPDKNTGYTGFYREEVKRNNEYQYFSEAVITVFKNSYKSVINSERIQRLQSRTIKSTSSKDTILLKVKSGLQTSLYLDVVRNPTTFLQQKTLSQYHFNLEETTYLDDELVFVVSFKPVPESTVRYRGKMWINGHSFTLIGVNFEYAQNRKDAMQELVSRDSRKIRKKFQQARYSIRYKQINETWYLNFVRTNLSVKIKKKGNWFYKPYSSQTSFYVVNIDTVNVKKPRLRESINPTIVFSDETFEYSPDFWGKYNYYKPSDKIIHDLKNMDAIERAEEVMRR